MRNWKKIIVEWLESEFDRKVTDELDDIKNIPVAYTTNEQYYWQEDKYGWPVDDFEWDQVFEGNQSYEPDWWEEYMIAEGNR